MDKAMEALKARMQRLLSSIVPEVELWQKPLEPADPLELCVWPPKDASELIEKWEELGFRQIPLSAGVTVSNLKKWLYSDCRGERLTEDLAAVRQFLWEGLPAAEVPQADPVLEEWRRISIPDWRRILRECRENRNSRREEYARWILQEILLDTEYQEPQA